MDANLNSKYLPSAKAFVAFGHYQFLAHFHLRSEDNNPRVELKQLCAAEKKRYMINLIIGFLLIIIVLIIALIRRSSSCDGVYPRRVLQVGERKSL